jgi:hypothetical protein
MPDMILDGTGSSHFAKVDSENHLHTTASIESMIAHRSHYNASAFGISTPMLTLTTNGGRMLYIKNINSKKEFYLTDAWFSWNGGTSSRNVTMNGVMYFNVTEPTTNTTVGGAGVLNRSSSNTSNLTILYWDEVGDGMTGGDTGIPAFYWCSCQGHDRVEVQGAVILGTNATLAFNLQGDEVGEASINIFGYLKE